jgi:hypothetical protein
LKISVHEAEKLSLEQIGGFIAASEELRFECGNRTQRYVWVERVLVEQEYADALPSGVLRMWALRLEIELINAGIE